MAKRHKVYNGITPSKSIEKLMETGQSFAIFIQPLDVEQ
jgi:hypothetical protein